MPIFSIRCKDCNAIEEVFVHRAGDASLHCPKCGSANTERMVSRAAVGSGGGDSSACATDACPFIRS